jgi:hypothetical protein
MPVTSAGSGLRDIWRDVRRLTFMNYIDSILSPERRLQETLESLRYCFLGNGWD